MDYNKVAEDFFEDLIAKRKKNPNIGSLNDHFSKGETGILTYLTFIKNNITAGELSDEFNVSSARIASVLNSLAKKNYIVRKEDENDARKVIVSITDSAKNKLITSKKHAINKIANIFNSLGEEDTLNYIRITNKIESIILNDNNIV